MKIHKEETLIDICSKCLVRVDDMSEFRYDWWYKCPECWDDTLHWQLQIIERTEIILTIKTIELWNLK